MLGKIISKQRSSNRFLKYNTNKNKNGNKQWEEKENKYQQSIKQWEIAKEIWKMSLLVTICIRDNITWNHLVESNNLLKESKDVLKNKIIHSINDEFNIKFNSTQNHKVM